MGAAAGLLLNKCLQGGSRVACFHKTFTHQETDESLLTQLGNGLRISKTAFRNCDKLLRNVLDQCKRLRRIGVKGGQIAVVDTDHIHRVAQSIQFLCSVYLKQYLQPECVGIRSQTFTLTVKDAVTDFTAAPIVLKNNISGMEAETVLVSAAAVAP